MPAIQEDELKLRLSVPSVHSSDLTIVRSLGLPRAKDTFGVSSAKGVCSCARIRLSGGQWREWLSFISNLTSSHLPRLPPVNWLKTYLIVFMNSSRGISREIVSPAPLSSHITFADIELVCVHFLSTIQLKKSTINSSSIAHFPLRRRRIQAQLRFRSPSNRPALRSAPPRPGDLAIRPCDQSAAPISRQRRSVSSPAAWSKICLGL